MKLSKISFGNIVNVELELNDYKRFSENIRNEYCTINKEIVDVKLIVKNEAYKVELANKQQKDKWDRIISLKQNTLNWIKMIDSESIIHLQSHEFNRIDTVSSFLGIGVGDHIEEELRTKIPNVRYEPNIFKWLREHFVLNIGLENKSIIFISTGKEQTEISDGFRIHGEEYDIDINKENDKYVISRIVKRNNLKYPIRVLRCGIEFKNYTTAALASQQVQEYLAVLKNSNSRYMELWQEYMELEKELIVSRAKEIGRVKYEYIKKDANKNGYLIRLLGKDEEIGDWIKSIKDNHVDTLEVDKSEPAFFKTGVLYNDSREEKFIYKINLEFIDESKGELLLEELEEESGEPYGKGFIFKSLLGDSISMKRKEQASEKIKMGRIPMPQLTLLLEGKDPGIKKNNYKKGKSAKIIKQLKKEGKNLNIKQEVALEMAFTNPDVTIIQGPPGTGKTQVVSMIIERLIEDAKEDGRNINKKILTTAFQHDAVGNLSERTKIMGLPTLKLDKGTRLKDTLISWKEQKVKHINRQVSEITEPAIKKVARGWLLEGNKLIKPKIGYEKELVGKIKGDMEAYGSMLNLETKHAFRKLINKLEENNSPVIESIWKTKTLGKIKLIPETVEQFSNGGPDICYDLLSRIKKNKIEILNRDEKILKELADYFEEDIPTQKQINGLVEIKNELFNKLSTNELSESQSDFPRKEWDEWLHLFINGLRNYSKANNKDAAIKDILEEYKEDLNDYQYLEKTIRKYQPVLASTIQQSVSRTMYDLLDENHDSFDYVIVDEAARANPLDLFIALSRGKKTILVGDQQQLPHIIENKLEKTLLEDIPEEEVKTAKKEMLEKSLFGRLYNYLKKMEPRRVIMLDTQYRMHPNIGDFISRQFYEKFGLGKIKSGVLEEERRHGIRGLENKQMVWMECREGKEKKIRSVSRLSEVQKIIRWVADLIDEYPELSFGIITFYAAQVDLLKKECLKFDLTKRENNGEIEINGKYKWIDDSRKERLRIGTVDSFQGKEFDVQILSIVRSNTIKIRTDGGNAHQKYGFLTLFNRLNVAMSRVQQLLVVAGDSRMVKTMEAEKYINGLYEFYQITQKEDYGTTI